MLGLGLEVRVGDAYVVKSTKLKQALTVFV